jgi:hypothetical protein
LQKLNGNTKLQKLKGRQNTKIIAETDEIQNFAEAEDKIIAKTHRRVGSAKLCSGLSLVP